MIKLKMVLVIGLAILGLLLAGYGISPYLFTASGFHSAQLLPAPRPMIEFTLENQKGARFTEEELKGHWNLVFFGFTHCPDMCPLELQALTKVLQMAKQQNQTQVQAVFISLDPERDSAQKISNYLATFNSTMVGLRGANSELVLLNSFFNIDHSRSLVLSDSPLTIPAGVNMPDDIVGDYQVEHSGRIFIIDPDGKYLGSFAQPHSAKNIWEDLQMIIKR